MPLELRKENILPESVRRPGLLLLVWIIPQAILLVLNLHGYDLASGEMEKSQQTRFIILLVTQGLLLLGGAGLMAGLLVQRRLIPWSINIPILALHIGYLWLAAVWITGSDDMLPREVTQWILPPERLLFYQFCFIMPAGFYAGLRMACFPMTLGRGKDLGISLGLAIGVPVCWYLVFFIGSHVTRRFFNFPDIFGVVFFFMITAATVLVLAAVVRVLALLYLMILRKGQHGMMVLTVLVGIAMPIGGLWLNRHIPFPFDFQTPIVYVMAVINGLVLLLPTLGRPRYDRAVWLAQALMFPFTLYFFLVFLPFLPLSLPAMIAFGAGFLILAPLALFLIHGMRLIEGFQRERLQLGLMPALVLILLALAVWPGSYTARGILHKQVMEEAIAYVYEKDPAEPQRFDGSRGMLKISLRNMKDLNSGFELPFLTSYYSWLVFDGLVLPDAKMQHIHRVFFGEKLEVDKERGGIAGELFGRSSRNNGSFNRLRTAPPTGVELQQIEVSTGVEQGAEKAVARITMNNPTQQLSEFVTKIEVPPGVYLSGYWLTVGEERVPGRIFEKKTALWVYKMIRDTGPRDPGILVYQNPGEIELRVYPFNSGEKRTCEIEFLYPAGFTPDIRIGGKALALERRPDFPAALGSRIEGEGWHLAVSPEGQRDLPRVVRKPYLHFMLDRSAHAASLDVQFQRLQAAAAAFPDAETALVTAANYEQVLLTPDPVPVSGLSGSELRRRVETLPPRGGFFEERLVQSALMEYDRRCSDPQEGRAWSMRYPVVIVMSSADAVPVGEGDLSYFSLVAPETRGYWRVGVDDQRGWVSFQQGRSVPSLPLEVALFRAGRRYRAAAFSEPAMMSVFLPGLADQPVEVLDAAGNARAVDGLQVLPAGARYAQGAEAWLGYLDALYRPGLSAVLMPKLVGLSRSTGILLPVTSYIVVENTAQWKMLEQKESQKLDNQSALEFMNTPEPSFWILLVGFLAFMGVRRIRRLSRRIPARR